MNTFDFLSPGGQPVFVTRLPNERGKGKPVHRYIHNETELQGFISTHDEPGYALYHAVAILKEGAWRNKQNVEATRYIWTEVDFKDHPDFSAEEIRCRIETIPLRPTAVIFSGHGYHLYWQLREDVDAKPGEAQQRVEEALKLAVNYVSGDAQVAEAARIMRLPGSHNTRVAGEELPVVFDALEMSRAYELDELVDFFLGATPILPPPAAKKPNGNGHDTGGFGFEQQSERPASGPTDVDERLAAMRWQGAGDSAVHVTQRDVTASLTGRGRPVEETVARVLAATKAMAVADPRCAGWDWAAEEDGLRRLCFGFINKTMRENGEDLGHCLPDKLYEAWNRIIAEGGIPEVFHNLSGACVRRSKRSSTEGKTGPSEGDEQNGGAEEPEGKPQEKKRRIRLLPYDAPDPAKIPRRDWLYGFHYMRKIVSATVGPGGIGKSSLGLVEAVGMAIGRDLLGKEKPKRPLRVWYHNGEDPRDEINRRIAAVCIRYGLDEAEVRKNLFVTCGLDMPIKVARGATEVKLDRALVEDIIGVIRDEKIDVAIFDPLVTMHNTSELLTATMDPVIREVFAAIAHETNASVELAHHTRKKANSQDEYTVADARGSSGIVDAVRAMRVANAMAKEEAEAFGIDELERDSYFRITKGKANMVRRGGSRWYRFSNVTLPNGDPEQDIPGDDVGVLTAWEPPNLDVSITDDDRRWVVDLVTANPMLQEDYRAKNWIGRLLGPRLGLDPDNKVDRFRISGVVKKMIEGGTLKLVERPDQKGKKRWYLAVPNAT
jgi:AAA domain